MIVPRRHGVIWLLVVPTGIVSADSGHLMSLLVKPLVFYTASIFVLVRIVYDANMLNLLFGQGFEFEFDASVRKAAKYILEKRIDGTRED
jgi:hypothetical protein